MRLLRNSKHTLQALGLTGGLMFGPMLMADELTDQHFELAEMAIEEAQEVEAESVAGAELMQAQQKLQEARDYNEDGEALTAERLLEQSRLHAELAETRALHAMARNSLDEINDTLETLDAELRRNP